jgi:hypothetical protein
MKTTHTPGPWSIDRSRYPGNSINGARIVATDGTQVGSVTGKADKSVYQKNADALLMAAAPDLLDMLRASGVNLVTAANTIERLGAPQEAAAVRRMAEQILPVIAKATTDQ